MYSNFLKRSLDFLIALILFILSLPLLLLLFIVVKLDSSGPFFYFQDRLGYQGKVFRAYKIRSMTNKIRVKHYQTLAGNSEITRIGKLLRRFKIDELPQIINVIMGDMSLIGPRPCLPEQRKEFNYDGEMRLLVRPGLTGLAQVNGNIYLSWPERWVYDRIYVEKLNFILDLQILFKTFLILFKGEEKFINKP